MYNDKSLYNQMCFVLHCCSDWALVCKFALLLFFFAQGWYIVTYAIGIFMLNQFIAFLTPKIDPAMRDYEGTLLLF